MCEKCKDLGLVNEFEEAAQWKVQHGELPPNLSEETREQIDADPEHFDRAVRTYAYARDMAKIVDGEEAEEPTRLCWICEDPTPAVFRGRHKEDARCQDCQDREDYAEEYGKPRTCSRVLRKVTEI
jgi:hypothetical protein